MENGSNKISVGSFVDTADWKLILSIRKNGMEGLLKNIRQSDKSPLLLFSNKWDYSESDFLKNVEDTVYSNPRLLDDFSTRIIITSDQNLWVPSELTDDEEFDPEYFTAVYEASDSDIFADFMEEETCLYSSAPGLNSFLARTLPGCLITSHLTILKSHYRQRSKKGFYIFADIRDGEMDIVSFFDSKLMSATTHPYTKPADLKYYIQLLGETYAFATSAAIVGIYGKEDDVTACHEAVSPIVKETMIEVIPDDWKAAEITHAVGLALEK